MSLREFQWDFITLNRQNPITTNPDINSSPRTSRNLLVHFADVYTPHSSQDIVTAIRFRVDSTKFPSLSYREMFPLGHMPTLSPANDSALPIAHVLSIKEGCCCQKKGGNGCQSNQKQHKSTSPFCTV